ncbi:MAG: ActS/PrrB/RegB family redox-sensitive histidine kinase [Rhodobacteraceae bacterium]|nr:ActS/PrrB/RegB family redox-sensitive histidine kinase [Paracoccaceae bacterium]
MRTLVFLRWMAVVGQVSAILVAEFVYGFQLELGLCFMAVGAATSANLVAMAILPGNKRLSETEALLTLLFDISQLAFLLYLTGGIDNPFALLILAPVTISATALQLRTTLFLGAAAIALMTVLALFRLPLRMADGSVLTVPATLSFGFWLAIVIGIAFLGLYSRRVASEIRSMSDALLATQMALAREQKLTDLGGVVAAAAHELGTPLATIKLVSTELMDELADWPVLAEDAQLIRDQADRCRDILRSMGRAGKDDLHLHQAPLEAVIREAAEPHMNRGKTIHIALHPARGSEDRPPNVQRRPEIIHGLRNLLQNAVDFARGNVWVDAVWTATEVAVRIVDDGTGYPPGILGRIGDPFVRARPAAQASAERPEYEGMGLGLFIAKTLLERSGADLSFANALEPHASSVADPERCGAIVEVIWPRDRIEAQAPAALGENKPILA